MDRRNKLNSNLGRPRTRGPDKTTPLIVEVRRMIAARRQAMNMTLKEAAAGTRGKLTPGQWWYLENTSDEPLDALGVACTRLGLRVSDLIRQAEDAVARR